MFLRNGMLLSRRMEAPSSVVFQGELDRLAFQTLFGMAEQAPREAVFWQVCTLVVFLVVLRAFQNLTRAPRR